MKPHLLYLAFWYPPSRASGVYRALGTSKLFLDSGWDVTVITCNTEFLEDEVGSVDGSLLDEVPHDLEVVRVPFTFDLAGSIDIRSLRRFGANYPLAWNWIQRKTYPIRYRASRLRRRPLRDRGYLDRYAAWIDPAVEAGKDLGTRQQVDHVLATGNPYSAFEAARLLGAALDVPFSVDYRDPWTIDVFTGRAVNKQVAHVEERIVEESWRCFHVNEPIAASYRERYPGHAEKHLVVHNGYDAESISPPPQPSIPPYRFGILGTVNERWPLDPVFAAWQACRPSLPDGSELILGGHLGYFARPNDQIEARFPSGSEGFRYVGPIPKTDVAKFYSSIDVVILPVPGGSMVTSGKVFEVNALGKPVVCVQAVGGGARAILRENPLAIAVEPETRAVTAALRRAADMASHLDPVTSQRVRQDATQFERHAALRPLVDAIAGALIRTDQQ